MEDYSNIVMKIEKMPIFRVEVQSESKGTTSERSIFLKQNVIHNRDVKKKIDSQILIDSKIQFRVRY